MFFTPLHLLARTHSSVATTLKITRATVELDYLQLLLVLLQNTTTLAQV